MIKVAIIKNGNDIGRIIPFNKESDNYDFKLSFFDFNIEIDVFKLFHHHPIQLNIDNNKNWEISYHRATDDNPPVIHLKETKTNNPIYKKLPLIKLIDPSPFPNFPVPLLRVVIPSSLPIRNFKKKQEHSVMELNDNNVVEFYLAKVDFDFNDFIKLWPSLSLNLMFLSFEFFASNTFNSDKWKMNYFMPTPPDTRIASQAFVVNEDLQLFCNIYKIPDNNKDILNLTFIENKLFLAVLGLTLADDKDQNGRFFLKHSYQLDLERGNFSSKERKRYERKFEELKEEFLKEKGVYRK